MIGVRVSSIVRTAAAASRRSPLLFRTFSSPIRAYASTACHTVDLDGYNVQPEDLVCIAQGASAQINDETWARIKDCRQVIDNVVNERRTVYGINTGFGNFAKVRVSPSELVALQENLVRSHASGVGAPLSKEQTRMLLALRINVLAKGFSGIRPETVEKMLSALNKGALPRVPARGSVGASGDLAPLAHLALGLMGEGEMWRTDGTGFAPSADVLSELGLEPITLSAKEGLALINGTQLITSLTAEAVSRASMLEKQACIVASICHEALRGASRPAYRAAVQNLRPHKGQSIVAERMRALLGPTSEIAEHEKSKQKTVQDSYTLRCIPQVHGIAKDTIDFVRDVITTELNSATDNPMVFSEAAGGGVGGITLSGGNFHGEFPAKMADMLAIGVHELASISERRLERLMNPDLSKLPAFLVNAGGLNSGFMIAHCTAAALVSENKGLCHPNSVDTISTSAGQEDHVSMGPIAARNAVQVVENSEYCLGIELVAAVQGTEFLRPHKMSPALEAARALVREHIAPYDHDRYFTPDLEAAATLLREGQLLDAVRPHLPAPETEVDPWE